MHRVVAALCLLLALMPAHAQVTRTEGREGDERIVTLENEHLRLVIFSDLGGRIGHMIDLATGEDLLYWDLSPDAVYGGQGGALDDRLNTFEQYAAELPADDPGAVRLVYDVEGVRIEKTVSLRPGASSIRIDYRFANASQRDLADYSVMTKNFLTPSGGPVTADDLYCIPTSRGVRRIPAFSGSWNYPELREKFKRDVGPWNAMVSTTDHRALAAAFSSDYFRWFYYWKGGIDYPTYEWVYQPLPAGMQSEVSIFWHIARGLDGVSHADERVVANTERSDAGLVTSVFAGAEALTGATLETEVQRLPDEGAETLAAVALPDIPLAQVGSVAIPWQPGDGTWVVRQRIVRGGAVVSEWEEPIEVGAPSGEYVREPSFPAVAQIAPLPGWERIVVQDLVQPTDADRARGFVAYLDEFAPEAERGRHVERVTLDMGRGEIKSIGLRIRALEPLDNVAVTATPGDLGAGQIEVFGVEEIDVSNEAAGKSNLIGRKLIPWPLTDLEPGEEAEVWLRVRTSDSDAGRRTAALSIRSRGREAVPIEVALNVRPVALPRPLLISHEAEHQLMGLPGCWNAEEGRWNEEVVERYARDLGEHNVDFEQGFWGWFSYARQPEQVLLATTGETYRDFIAGNPDYANAPPLDFSYLNPVFDAAIRHGLVRFSTNSSGGLPPTEQTGWLMAEAARYLRDRGYPDRDIWCKHLDEQPATTFPRMVEEVQWLREHGFRPFSTFHNVLANPSHMAVLNPAFDLFQGGFSRQEDVAARLGDGTLEPTDETWMYQGWGATWYSYAQNRRPGWFAAAAGLDGYHTHVYYRWSSTDAVIFPTEQGPESSPAWEAMRDGLSDAQWVALARRWIERLDRASARRPALGPVVVEARRRLGEAIGGSAALIHLTERREGLHWVERLVDFDVPTADAARAVVLDLLADLQPHVQRLGPSLYYGAWTLAEQGDVRLWLAPASDPQAAALLSRLLAERFGVTPRSGVREPEGFVVDLRIGDLRGWRDADLHITERYPAAGEYVIHVDDSGQHPRMLIFGRDAAGLEKGIRNWGEFLRTEQPGAVG